MRDCVCPWKSFMILNGVVGVWCEKGRKRLRDVVQATDESLDKVGVNAELLGQISVWHGSAGRNIRIDIPLPARLERIHSFGHRVHRGRCSVRTSRRRRRAWKRSLQNVRKLAHLLSSESWESVRCIYQRRLQEAYLDNP